MSLTRLALTRPAALWASVLLVALLGWLALQEIPVQLAPDIRQPTITVRTDWPGAAPAEIEREILIPQEEALAGLEGVEEMLAVAQQGRGRITLTFAPGTDMERARALVERRIERVRERPREAAEPDINTVGTEDNAIAWLIITARPGVSRPIHTFRDLVEETVQRRLERIPGVAEVTLYGGARRELQVVIDPRRLAARRLTVAEVMRALQEAEVGVTAGFVAEGKRHYVVRIAAPWSTPGELARIVVRSVRDPATGRLLRVRLGDVARVQESYGTPTATIRYLGRPALALSVTRELGANVLDIMAELRREVAELSEGVLAEKGLSLVQVYDETVYIQSAIDLVVQNIYLGGALAALVLFLFLRSFKAALVVLASIPLSVVATFVVMAALGRSLNVVSLAGIAFAVGMVVDAAIVVLENIHRLRRSGAGPLTAALQGTREVWPAIFLAAFTTVIVFVPLLRLELEVGQLFRDIAVAISVAVTVSLLVATTVVPALARRWLGEPRGLGRPMPLLDAATARFAALLLAVIARITANRPLALVVVVALLVSAAGFVWRFAPQLDYLPEGNRNLVFGVLLPPPGYNREAVLAIAARLEDAVRPLWRTSRTPARADREMPQIDRFFFVAVRGSAFVGASAVDPERARDLIPPLSRAVRGEPGTFGFFSQPSIFGRGLGGGRVVRLDISGPDLASLSAVAERAMVRILEAFPRSAGHQLRPRPELAPGAPEIRLVPDPRRLADAGLSPRDFALAVDVLNDGVRVKEVVAGGERIDLVLRGPERNQTRTQDLAALPIVTPQGRVVEAGALAEVRLTAGPSRIRRVDGLRTITLELRPARRLSLETAILRIEREVLTPLREEGLPAGVSLRLGGTADKLTRTFAALWRDLLLAAAIVALALTILFESVRHALVVMVAVPLAAAGGIIGLVLLNRYVYQPLDMLTMLGFVILTGIVVNNAILIVERSRRRFGLGEASWRDAVLGAVRDRLRPIFMTTLTSVFGMLPLVAMPGAGSEIYRGLGSVVVGGLALSALLTLLLVPSLLVLLHPARRDSSAATPRPADLAAAE